MGNKFLDQLGMIFNLTSTYLVLLCEKICFRVSVISPFFNDILEISGSTTRLTIIFLKPGHNIQ